MNKNEFAVVPPMGWNSFDYYDANVTEAEIRANAEYMANHLKPFGWEYIVVDIQWYAYDTGTQREKYEYVPFSRVELDEYGRLLPCPIRFPSSAGGKGFAPLAEYIHSLGLKFGIHIMRGIARSAAEQHLPVKGTSATADQIANASSICLWNSDMYGVSETPEGQSYYDSIVELYASWGVDFIKCDDICNSRMIPSGDDAQVGEIRMLAKAIQKSGRPIVLSLSPGPALTDRGSIYMEYANMWRLAGDIWDNWKQLRDMFDRCEKWTPFVKKGCYPDCDMLPLGRIGKEFLDERQSRLTCEEQRTMMTLWCMTHSPLMLGAELTKMDEETLALVTNREVISLNQSMDHTVLQLCKDEKHAVWISQTPDRKKLYIGIFNFQNVEAEIPVAFWQFSDKGIDADNYTKATDLWDGGVIAVKSPIQASVGPHGVKLLRMEM